MSEEKATVIVSLVILSVMFLFFCGSSCVKMMTHETVPAAQVTRKEAVKDDAGYLIFTKRKDKKDVYSNEDSWIDFKFNSSDVYNEIEEGKCYDLKVNYVRVPMFSMYQNILSVKEVPCPK